MNRTIYTVHIIYNVRYGITYISETLYKFVYNFSFLKKHYLSSQETRSDRWIFSLLCVFFSSFFSILFSPCEDIHDTYFSLCGNRCIRILSLLCKIFISSTQPITQHLHIRHKNKRKELFFPLSFILILFSIHISYNSFLIAEKLFSWDILLFFYSLGFFFSLYYTHEEYI